MFHDLTSSSKSNDLYTLPAKAFRLALEQLHTWSTSVNSKVVPFSPLPVDGIVVTFDDGYRSTLTIAAPSLVDHQMPFHVFVTKSFVQSGDEKYLSVDNIVQLSKTGLATFGVHGDTHRAFSTLSPMALRRELHDSRDWLEQILGHSVQTLSYPFGDYDQRTIDATVDAGFVAAACSRAGTYVDELQRYNIPRVDIWSIDSPDVILAKIRGCWDVILR